MSSAEEAVHAFRELESEDFRILHIIEAAMSKREFVPIEQIQKYAKLPMDRIQFTLCKLSKLGLIDRTKGAYNGYKLNSEMILRSPALLTEIDDMTGTSSKAGLRSMSRTE